MSLVMKTAQATKLAASCVPPRFFSSGESQKTMSCLCLRFWKMCPVHKGHCSCFPLQDLLTYKNYSFVSFLSYIPILFLSEWTCQLTQECTTHFFLQLTWKSSGGRARTSATHSAFQNGAHKPWCFTIHSRKISERLQLPIDYSPLESGQGEVPALRRQSKTPNFLPPQKEMRHNCR